MAPKIISDPVFHEKVSNTLDFLTPNKEILAMMIKIITEIALANPRS